jgi:hypothetical protein
MSWFVDQAGWRQRSRALRGKVLHREGRNNAAVSAGEWLTWDVNQLSWYVAALGSSYNVSNWHPCIPSGHLATAILERNPDQVLLCGCDPG